MEIAFKDEGGATPEFGEGQVPVTSGVDEKAAEAEADRLEAEAEVVNEVPKEAKPVEAAPAGPGVTPATALVTRPPGDSRMAPVNRQLGDFPPGYDDIMLGRVQIAHPVGDVGKTFPPGCLVFDRELAIYEPAEYRGKELVRPATKPVVMVFLGFRPVRYVQKVAGGARGLVCNSIEEVAKKGGTLAYAEAQLDPNLKFFQPLAEAMVLVRRPDHIVDPNNTKFPYEADGGNWLVGLMSFKGASYTAACKKVLFQNRLVGSLRAGYPTRVVQMATRLEHFTSGNDAWVPAVSIGAETGPQMRELVQSFYA